MQALPLAAAALGQCCPTLHLPPERAEKLGQNLTKIPYKDTFWKGTTRTRPRKDRGFPAEHTARWGHKSVWWGAIQGRGAAAGTARGPLGQGRLPYCSASA